MFTPQQLKIVEFCAQECARQGSGELSVAWMVAAYERARAIKDEGRPLTMDDIFELGQLVEPQVNENGFRTVPVSFRNGNVVGWQHIVRQLTSLLGAQDVLSPLQFYTEFEKIHPFCDGNGRVGALIYNLLNGTLDDPVTPPEVQF